MKLTVIIASYRMQREIPRTLMSSLPPCQLGVADLDYEIIVVDNGSPEPLVLPETESSRANVKLIRVPTESAEPTPVKCMNEAVLDHASGEYVLICVDGARIFSPYLVRRTVDVLDRHPNAFTFVASRHLGSECQMEAVTKGYDQEVEDSLLDSVDWKTDLDALWGISVWAGCHERNNFLQQNESNAIGFSRMLWDELGGYNQGFKKPGGGLCNLELFSRAMNRPNALNVLLLGEATFHQFHGGAATSKTDYFQEGLEEHIQATGQPYTRQRFEFLADAGANYARVQKIGKYLK